MPRSRTVRAREGRGVNAHLPYMELRLGKSHEPHRWHILQGHPAVAPETYSVRGETTMMHKVARTGLIFLLTLLIAASVPLLAQNQTDKDANSKTSDSKDKNSKDKDKAKNKKKNSDVENIGNRNINKGSINFFSLDREIAMGRQLAAEIERQVKLNEDPTINEYVNRGGQNLVRNSDAKVPFTIKVVESDEINAFALPGGFFYINTGLILAADDESELAGVMAHEIAHVAARHGTKQASK